MIREQQGKSRHSVPSLCVDTSGMKLAEAVRDYWAKARESEQPGHSMTLCGARRMADEDFRGRRNFQPAPGLLGGFRVWGGLV